LAFNIPSVDSHVFYLLTYHADDQACMVFLIVELAVLNAFRASLYFNKAYVSKRFHGAVGGVTSVGSGIQPRLINAFRALRNGIPFVMGSSAALAKKLMQARRTQVIA
jgi:hypothetical protein